MKKKDFNPVAWVGRLREVNRDSQFHVNEKTTIESYLKELGLQLETLRSERGVREES